MEAAPDVAEEDKADLTVLQNLTACTCCERTAAAVVCWSVFPTDTAAGIRSAEEVGTHRWVAAVAAEEAAASEAWVEAEIRCKAGARR